MIHIKINYNNEIIVPLCLNAGDDRDIADMQVSEYGSLIITLNDGSKHSLGQLVGEDGIIYKPHVERDEHDIFTFTFDGESLDMEVSE